MKPLLVVNPRSSGGATGRTFSAVRGTIERALGEVDVAMTERAGHGIELARRGALAGHPLVIAVGGDGTIHEVVNGLMQARAGDGAASKGVELGIIGQGTGGDLCKTLGVEHRLDRYVEAIASGRQRPIDVGRFTCGDGPERYFVNILSAGMGGLVDRYIADAPRLFGGKAAYFGASLKALWSARLGSVRCVVTKDGETNEHVLRSFMIAVCNGRYFGGGMKVAPMAELDDGVLEIVALGATSKVGVALTSGSIYAGKHIGRAGTVHLRGQKVTFDLLNQDARGAFLLDVDGEPMGELPVAIEVVPRSLTLRG